MSLTPDQLDELHGVRVEHVELRNDGRVVLVFGHRGTDDGSGYLVVDQDDVHFGAEPAA